MQDSNACFNPPLLFISKAHAMSSSHMKFQDPDVAFCYAMLISSIIVTHTPRATIEENADTTFASLSRFAAEKKKK